MDRRPPAVDDGAAVPPGSNREESLEKWREHAGVTYDTDHPLVWFENVRLPARRQSGEKIDFSAYAFNRDRVRSPVGTLPYTPPPPTGSVKPRAYLVCVGVAGYQDPVWNLDFGAGDARQMLDVIGPGLRSAGYDLHPTLLVSDKPSAAPSTATKQRIRDALAQVARQATPDDLVLISFSGHGYAAPDNDFYLLPSDIGEHCPRDRPPPADMLARCISEDELSRWLSPIDGGEMVLVIDACQSAASVDQPWFKPGPLGSRRLGQLAYDKRMRVLAASQVDDFAIESYHLRQGLLTYALTNDALEKKAADLLPRDGRITLDEWLDYAVGRVPRLYEAIVMHQPIDGSAEGPNRAGGKGVLRVPGAGQGSDYTFRNAEVVSDADSQGSSLRKKHTFQSPQLFNYTRKLGSGAIIKKYHVSR